MIEEVALSKNANAVLDHYRARFEELFGEKCKVRDLDHALRVIKSVIQDYGFEKTRGFIDRYFAQDDAWLRSKGYPIEFLPRSVNALIVGSAPKVETAFESDLQETRYVVALTEKNGAPVIDKNPGILRGHTKYKPVPIATWQELPYEERLQGMYRKGHDVERWFNYWMVHEASSTEPWVKGVLKKKKALLMGGQGSQGPGI